MSDAFIKAAKQLRCPNAKATLTGTIGDCVQPQS